MTMIPFCPDEGCLLEMLVAWSILDLEVAVPRPIDMRYLIGYVRKVGVIRVSKKIASRRVASRSEARVVLGGIARVVRAPHGADLQPGELVWCVAPRAIASAGHVVTSPLLVRAITGDVSVEVHARHEWSMPPDRSLCDAVRPLAGWSVHADEALDAARCHEVMDRVEAALRMCERRTLVKRDTLNVWRRQGIALPAREGRPGVVLFGCGHYARTCLLPTLSRCYDIANVHEIDVSLVGAPAEEDRARWSVSPLPDADDVRAALWCVATYHHHHARLAVRALEAGVDVLVEKPLVTCEADLDALLVAWRASDARLWQGFHRRTWQVQQWLEKDLEIQRGESVVHYHCVVHEVSLPVHHWYRWASSGSRLVMNGCHWLDEFMFLNGGRQATRLSAQKFHDGEVVMVQVELEHGATFSMTLSSVGSDRLGVRESTHISHGTRSAQLHDQRYTSEHATGELRSARVQESETYARMVRAVSAAQRDPLCPGEQIEEVERFWRMVFALDALLDHG